MIEVNSREELDNIIIENADKVKLRLVLKKHLLEFAPDHNSDLKSCHRF